MKSNDCTLFSGGAKGAEEEFGVQAKKFGVHIWDGYFNNGRNCTNMEKKS